MRVLANEPNSVTELVMNSTHLPTGINCTIFDEPCEEYDDFAAVLKPLASAVLILLCSLADKSIQRSADADNPSLNGRLRRALGEAKDNYRDPFAQLSSACSSSL